MLNTKTYRILEKIRDKGNTKVMDFDIGRVTLIDAGLDVEGDKETGIKVAEASMAGLGKIEIGDKVHVEIKEMPAVATLSSQLAGWCIKVGGKHALGSGPARILAKKPTDIINKIGYSEESDKGALILETHAHPDRETCRSILKQTKTENLIIAVFREDSITGLINILARVVEVGIFRLSNLNYDVNRISYASGTVPMIRLSDKIMFKGNDAIIYEGSVELKVDKWDPKLTEKAVSGHSEVHGRSFEEIFLEAGGDFYEIPPDIFAPAHLKVTDLRDNRVYLSKDI